MPAATYQQGGVGHTPSSSIDSTISAASSTRPLNPNPGSSIVQRQDFASPAVPATRGLNVVNNGPTSGQYDSPIPVAESGPQQSRYITMLKSVEKIPRLHTMLAIFFAWALLAGFVIMPGSFTSVKRTVDEASGIPINLGNNRKLILSKANTATMVVGFVLTVAGTFGTAWLALRWRRNYVWLLNRIYMPLVLNSSVGFIATLVGVYAMSFGEWSTQAIIAALIETSVLVVSGILFLVYNHWLLLKVREDQMELTKEKGKGKGKGQGRMRLLSRFRGLRRNRPIAPGSVV
ncbi:hypothetical protein QBC43DRAFT_252239 [Cladorrhinum sp. PSN259]|nr:hypothetical protein QBC43DRAFT_252239 [Cladorrhinum sp. PSN259]